MLFFIQFSRIPPSGGCALRSARRCLDGVAATQAHSYRSQRQQNSSLCRWNQPECSLPRCKQQPLR